MARNVIMLETTVKGLFMCTSFYFKKEDVDRKYPIPTVTFLVKTKDENTIVEWEPNGGAITLIEKCDKDYKFKEDEYGQVKPHWLLGWCKGYGNWDQLAVYDEGLPEAVEFGNLERIYEVLNSYIKFR